MEARQKWRAFYLPVGLTYHSTLYMLTYHYIVRFKFVNRQNSKKFIFIFVQFAYCSISVNLL